MLTLESLRNPTDAAMAGFDLAAVDLACATGLPGAEHLDIAACLAWIDQAAAWVGRQTEATFGRFLDKPSAYDNSEGLFRVVSMMNVLWRGLGVRYNPDRIGDTGEWTDSRDDFIHGIIAGQGGTCASLPVLVVAVGRRLGYPLKLVTTACHQFVRWDDPGGERFNCEINNTGLNKYEDEHYLRWPVDIRYEDWRTGTKFLRSMTPRDEVAHSWSKRGHCQHANGCHKEAVDSFATACSLVGNDRLIDRCLWELLRERKEVLGRRTSAWKLRLQIYFPSDRRYPGLPIAMERDIISLDIIEGLLNAPPASGTHVVCVPRQE